ncbi:MAG: MBL fold metallo-hydrolase [Cystobacter sp.]
MSRPVRILMTLLGLWLFGGCEQSPAGPAPTPPATAQASPARPARYFGRPADGQLHVFFLDVGQGDATLIVSPTGRTVLVDAGPATAGVHLANRLPELLTGKLDLVILTHPEPDHYGGLSAVLDSVGALRLLEPQLPGTSAEYDALLGTVGASGIEVTSPAPPANGDPLKLPLGGGAELTVLWPRAPTEKLLTGERTQQLNSIVLRLTHGDVSMLLPGDALEKTEQLLMRRGAPLDATLLKVAAHGATTASSEAFLDAVSARVALISTGGANNPEGTPARDVVKRLEAMNTRVLRTDREGEVMAVSDGRRIALTAQRRAAGGPQEAEFFEGKSRTEEWSDVGLAPRDTAGTRSPGKADPVIANAPKRVDVDLDKAPPPPPPEKPREEKPRQDKPREEKPREDKPAKGGMRYVASRKSDVFHVPDCPAARRIKDENLMTFTTREQAADGNRRRPARDCNP